MSKREEKEWDDTLRSIAKAAEERAKREQKLVRSLTKRELFAAMGGAAQPARSSVAGHKTTTLNYLKLNRSWTTF